ncbi:MAG: hypothetical protein ACFB2W_06575 [Leptolyngbyaceae cyanobacterium]
MLLTYRAILKGSQVIWLESPPHLSEETEVCITILSPNPQAVTPQQRQAMADSLGRLANLNISSDLEPSQLQRDIRQDHSLPNRD